MKKLFGFILFLIVLVIAAALAAPYFITTESIKKEVIAQVEAATGRTLQIDGQLSIRLFPTAAVTAEKVTFSNPPGFEDTIPFATLSLMQVDVELMPLLKHNVVVNSFVLEDPTINLHQNKAGVKNWEFKKETPVQPGQPAPVEAADKTVAGTGAKSAPSLPGNISLSNIKLKNGTILFVNDATKERIEIRKADAKLSMSDISAPATLDGSAEWNGKMIKLAASIGTPQSLMNEKRTDIKADITADLVTAALQGAYEASGFTGDANITSSSLKELAVWLNPGAKPMATPALLALNLKSAIHCGTQYCNLSSLDATLDNLKASGTVKASWAEAKPSVDMDLTTNVLDLNAFLPPDQHASNDSLIITEALAEAGEHWSNAAMDLSGLKSVNATANIKTAGLLFHKITIGKAALIAKLQQGRLTADVADAEMYSGKGSISVVADGNTAPSSFELRASLKGVQLEPLLKDASDMDRLSGTADIQLNTTSRGQSQQQIVAALAGNGQMKISNGMIKRVNMLDMLHNIQSAFTKANSGAENTSFSEMGGTFTIAQGVISNQDLSMKMSGLNVSGQGTVNLPAYTISYRLTPQIVQTAKAKDGTATEKQGLGVPLLIAGSLDHPTFQPDLQAALKDAISDPAKLKDELKNSRGALKDQFKGSKKNLNLKGLLQGLQGN